jgi:hypothetical protein
MPRLLSVPHNVTRVKRVGHSFCGPVLCVDVSVGEAVEGLGAQIRFFSLSTLNISYFEGVALHTVRELLGAYSLDVIDLQIVSNKLEGVWNHKFDLLKFVLGVEWVAGFARRFKFDNIWFCPIDVVICQVVSGLVQRIVEHAGCSTLDILTNILELLARHLFLYEYFWLCTFSAIRISEIDLPSTSQQCKFIDISRVFGLKFAVRVCMSSLVASRTYKAIKSARYIAGQLKGSAFCKPFPVCFYWFI